MGTIEDLREDYKKMTVEQRADKIREIRRARRYSPETSLKKKEKKAKQSAGDNLAKLLAKMSPDEVAALKKEMGIE